MIVIQFDFALISNILKNADSIINNIANRFDLCFYNEYYSINSVLFDKTEDLVTMRPKETTWLQRIRVAFEHENNIDCLYQEISHLLITNTDLRVVVSYPEENDDTYLDEYKNIILASSIAKNPNFLLIFGHKLEDSIKWTGYEFYSGKWCELS